MADVEHSALHATANQHALHRWAPADQTARFALVVVSGDRGKVAWQLSDNTFWILRDHANVGNVNGWRQADDSAALAAAASALAAANEADDTADAAQADATQALADAAAAQTTADAAVPQTRTLTASTGLTGGGNLTANRSFACDFGSASGKVCEGNDSRLSDARTPTSHASTHKGDGADAILATITTEATTARTLAIADASDYIRCTSGSATAVTVPANATAAIPVGSQIPVVQAGTGTVTIVAAGGVTINPPKGGTLVLNGQHARCVLVKVATNEWDLWGHTVPA